MYLNFITFSLFIEYSNTLQFLLKTSIRKRKIKIALQSYYHVKYIKTSTTIHVFITIQTDQQVRVFNTKLFLLLNKIYKETFDFLSLIS